MEKNTKNKRNPNYKRGKNKETKNKKTKKQITAINIKNTSDIEIFMCFLKLKKFLILVPIFFLSLNNIFLHCGQSDL